MIIETEGLAKRFARHEAVHGVDLAVPEGAAMALIGANGAGKTTTLRMLMNILTPDAGRASVLGVDSRRLSHREFGRIGYVSENQKLPLGLTVDQFFDYLRPLYPTWDWPLEVDLRSRLDLPGGRKLGNLSHGMRVKTALAAALPFRPSLLVLDEPFSGLDPLIRDEIIEGLLPQAGELTILISSHELAEIESWATHVAFMDGGRLALQETLEALAARMRQVTVALSEATSVPARLPETWLAAQSLGQSLSFIDTAFTSDAELAKTLAARVGEFHTFEARPMSLRDISKALIRAGRRETAQ